MSAQGLMETPEQTIARLQDEIARDRASLLRQIGDNIPDGALYQVVADAQGTRRFVYWSAGIEQLIGVTPADAIAEPARLYRLIHPDDQPRVVASERKAIETHGVFDETMRMTHARSGEMRWVHLRSAPRALADGRTVWDGIYIDVTNQKNIEQALIHSLDRLDLAQRAGHIGVFDWDVQSGRLMWTEEEHRLFGIKPGTFAGTIDAWAERLLPEDAERMKEEMRAAMESRLPQMTFAFRIVTPTGAQRWIEGAARFSYDDNGKPLRMVGVNVDVTDRTEATNALRAADRRKSEFLAMLSHELRNPARRNLERPRALQHRRAGCGDLRVVAHRHAATGHTPDAARRRPARRDTHHERQDPAAHAEDRLRGHSRRLDLNFASPLCRAPAGAGAFVLARLARGRGRPDAARADRREPSHQCGEVHAARRHDLGERRT
jgi:PAS domain S-box-containing protein